MKNASPTEISKKTEYKSVINTFILALLVCFLPTSIWAQQVFEYFGGIYEDTIDANANEGSQLHFEIRGGDGGFARVSDCWSGGGNGAVVEFTLTVGYGANEIPPGTTLRYIVGGKGTDDNIVNSDNVRARGSGGGGTAVLANIDSSWEIIAVAGGGGGAYRGRALGFCVDNEPGQGGRSTTSGGNGHGTYGGDGGSNGEGGTGGGDANFGWTDLAGGGGGAFSDGTGSNIVIGEDDHRMGGKKGGNWGGHGGTWDDHEGGFGYGGGGSANSGGGGGGGYSGGGGGSELDNGGGGGSYLNSTYTANGNITAGGHDTNTEHGYIALNHECTINVTGFEYINTLCTADDQGRIQFNYTLADTGYCDTALDWRLLPINGWNYLGDGVFRSVRAGDYTLEVINTGTGDVFEYDFTVGVSNNTLPVAQCIDHITITLGPDGFYNNPDLAQLINDGSYHPDCNDNLQIFADQTLFSCVDVGVEDMAVFLLVQSENGAVSHCRTEVTVLPYEGPTANCVPDFELDLEGQRYKTLTIDDINDNSSFFCEGDGTIRFAPGTDLSYGCEDVGQTIPITLILTDYVGNTSECVSMVTIIDSSTTVAICKDTYTIALQNGTATLDPMELDNGSTGGNCDLTFSTDIDTFSCNDIGTQQVTLTVTSANGNTDSCVVDVTVTENGEFTAICKNITVALDENGTYQLDPNEINDNSVAVGCAPPTFTISQDIFTCDNLGDNLVTLTMTSSDGLQSSSCEATVTVIDDIAPTFDTGINDEMTVDIRFGGTIQHFASQFYQASSDNCGINNQGSGFTGPTLFTCDQVGTSVPSAWTIEDQSGNTYVHNFVVHVINTSIVNIECAPIDINVTNVQGQYTLTDGNIYNMLFNDAGDASSNLSCYDIEDFMLSQTTFDWAENPYSVDVTISLTEDDGTEHSCNTTVNVNPIDTAFVMTFKTSDIYETITIPTTGDGYNYSINWGDGTVETGLTGDATHVYYNPAVYTVLITGDFPRIYFNNTGDKEKILSLVEWGPASWSSMEGAFWGCSNLDVTAIDAPELTNVTSLRRMFSNCTSLIGTTAFNNWNVTNVQVMESMFSSAEAFNQPIGNWNTESVIDMSAMFSSAETFNQLIGNWNTGNVIDMAAMFSSAEAFNQPIGNWNTESVINMATMFANATSFNQNINNWNVAAVENMRAMFAGATNFNQDISGWNTSNVVTMFAMFSGADVFNQPIGNWDVSSALIMRNMFYNTGAFNQDLSNWNVSSVNQMDSMFYGAEDFDQDLSNWNIESLNSAIFMFSNSGLSNANYDNLLIGWATLDAGETQIPLNVNLGGGDSQYCTSEVKRQELIDTYGWNISDGGLDCYTHIFASPFVTTWETTSTNESITISTMGDGYNYHIDWGDGIIQNGVTGDAIHQYATPGIHTVSISGDFPRFHLDSQNNSKIKAVQYWGDIAWATMEYTFAGCDDLQVTATDIPDLSQVTNMSGMFRGCENLVGNLSFNSWDVSNVEMMGYMFAEATNFNQPLDNWNVIAVQDMEGMFSEATNFNQNINNWNVAAVEDMNLMFDRATNFNQPLDNWNVIAVQDMYGMFAEATSFNQNINNWNVAAVENMSGMFSGATNFNQPLDNWNVNAVQDMGVMFAGATNFNQPLNNWNVNAVQNMYGMFAHATSFNQNINNWNVSNVINMQLMFIDASDFNQPLDNWNVTAVQDMEGMFAYATSFNQNINNWNVAAVENMSGMFGLATDFNQPLNNWNVAAVENMRAMFAGATNFNQPLHNWDTALVRQTQEMFAGATNFDQDLGNWDISSALSMLDMFEGVRLSTQNYDNTLIGWATLDAGETQIPLNVNFGGGDSRYCASEVKRQELIDTYGWGITDGGLNCSTHILVSLKVYLQGASLNPNAGEETLMRDDFRVAGTDGIRTSPYVDGVLIDDLSAFMGYSGPGAFVDWVWVELRDKNDPTVVIAGQSGMLTRNGNIVDPIDISLAIPLSFNVPADAYYVVIKHRNHLGIMSNSAIAFSSTATMLNFTDGSVATYGTNAQTSFGMPNGIQGMWAGDANGDGKVNIIGAPNDTNTLRDKILNDPINSVIQFYGFTVSGYTNEDVNLSGGANIIGVHNDANTLRDNILNHPINAFLQFYGYNILEQLPAVVPAGRMAFDIEMTEKNRQAQNND
ncbi:BspA family leucine-rich repeat surface protein [Winogradskyella sp.]|uniref:BspA family leucine-rich repeat surface protein n=1 Tax=Winogradskyella sp. TaxID=1883156 RepID=UPI003BABC58B